jgi:hypothetical protein
MNGIVHFPSNTFHERGQYDNNNFMSNNKEKHGYGKVMVSKGMIICDK